MKNEEHDKITFAEKEREYFNTKDLMSEINFLFEAPADVVDQYIEDNTHPDNR